MTEAPLPVEPQRCGCLWVCHLISDTHIINIDGLMACGGTYHLSSNLLLRVSHLPSNRKQVAPPICL